MRQILVAAFVLSAASSCVGDSDTSDCQAHPADCAPTVDAGPSLPDSVAADCRAASGDLLELNGQPGEAIHPGSETLLQSEATFDSIESGGSRVSFSIQVLDGGSESWTIDFESQSDGGLLVGTYVAAESTTGTLAPGEPGFNLSDGGNTCTQDYAKFTVYQANWGLYGFLDDFVAGFEQQCDRGDAPVLQGCIAYHLPKLGGGTPDAGYVSASCEAFDPNSVAFAGYAGSESGPLTAVPADGGACEALPSSAIATTIRPIDGQLIYLSNNRIFQFAPAPFYFDAYFGWQSPDAGTADIELPTDFCDGGVGVGQFWIKPADDGLLYQCSDNPNVIYDSAGIYLMYGGLQLLGLDDQAVQLIEEESGPGFLVINTIDAGVEFVSGIPGEPPVASRSVPGGGFWVVLPDSSSDPQLWRIDDVGNSTLVAGYTPSPVLWAPLSPPVLDSSGNLYAPVPLPVFGDNGLVELFAIDGGVGPDAGVILYSNDSVGIDLLETPPLVQPILDPTISPITGP